VDQRTAGGLEKQLWLLLLCPAGVPELSGVECAADVLLAAAARLAGLMLRADGGLPMVRLAAGLAHGSCFLDYEGVFVVGWGWVLRPASTPSISQGSLEGWQIARAIALQANTTGHACY
jgi:hypothetical protein